MLLCNDHDYHSTKMSSIITGCSKEGVRQATHDSLTTVLHNILRMYGIHARRETCPFKAVLPKSKRRLDIVVTEGQLGSDKRLLLDVTITNPVNSHTRNARVGQDAASNAAYTKKIDKYSEHAEAVNCIVKPVVFESTGRLHPETTKLFKRIAGIEDGSKYLDDTNLYRYWMRVISVTLQRGLARAFLVGRKRLMSNNYKIPARFSLCNVSEFNDFYTMNNSSNDE